MKPMVVCSDLSKKILHCLACKNSVTPRALEDDFSGQGAVFGPNP